MLWFVWHRIPRDHSILLRHVKRGGDYGSAFTAAWKQNATWLRRVRACQIIRRETILLLLLLEIQPVRSPVHVKLWSTRAPLTVDMLPPLTIWWPRTWALTPAGLISRPSSSAHSLIPIRPSSAIWQKVIWCSMHTGCAALTPYALWLKAISWGTERNLFMVRSPTATRDVSVPACHTSIDFLLCIHK